MKIVRDIEDRLQGNYPKSKGLPLSIEGQVDDLIKVTKVFSSLLYLLINYLSQQAATSIENLSKMYVGWAAFM